MGRLVALVVTAAWLGLAQPVLIQFGPKSLALDFPSLVWPEWRGTVSLAGQEQYGQGLALAPIVQALGGMGEQDVLFILSPARELVTTIKREDVPSAVLVFSLAGERAENAALLYLLDRDDPQAFPVRWIILNWQGEKLPQVGDWPAAAVLTLITPEGQRTFTLAELETSFVALTYPGSFTRRTGEKVTAQWTGIPLWDLLGHWPGETEIEVVAADGYRLRYRYDALQDSEGMWILAFKEDGEYLPFNPGYFRMVKAGAGNPTFPSAASARMVTRLEVRGPYRPYALRLIGAREHVFTRWDLEVGVACPCRARAVTVTHKGLTRVYVGLPLWRLVAYVDDEVVPEGTGLRFDDMAFNWELARAGYLLEIRAADGFSQVIPISHLAGEDRFILALKVDGRFLEDADGGPLLFVWDDTAPAPAGLKRVKQVTEIIIRPAR